MSMPSHDTSPPGTEVPVITVAGEVDLAAAPGLEEELATLLEAGHRTIAVDLRRATFLDSTALGVLVAATESCRDDGGDLYLATDEPRVLKVFEITGLREWFTFCEITGGASGPTEPEDGRP